MADRVYLEPLYLIPRLAMWVALFILGILDGLRHRHTKSRGWQLYAFLLLTCALFVLRDLILMLFALLHSPSSSSTSHPAVFSSFIFLSNCAESSWITDLLMISAGYMITRTSLGPHKTVVLLVPSIFFITSLVTDFVFYSVAGSDAFSADPQTFYQATEEGQIAASSNIIFFICLVASLMTYLLSWFYIFDTITQERQILEGLKDPIASGLDPSARRGATGGSGYEGEGERGFTDITTTTTTTPPPGAAAVGHVALPPGGDVSMLLEPGSNASHLYGDVIAEDLDAHKTVADRVADKEKANLLQRFFIGVCAYVIASMASFLLPLFLPSVVDRTILAIQNVILWCFMAALLWTFKMREGNQYLALVEADNADTALVDDDDDDLNEDEDERAHTMEMGILYRGPTSHLDDTTNNSGSKDAASSSSAAASALPPRSLPPPPPPSSSTAAAATSIPPPPPPKPTSSPPIVAAEPAFVLEDIDDDDEAIDEIILKDNDDDGTDEASDVAQTVIKTAHQD